MTLVPSAHLFEALERLKQAGVAKIQVYYGANVTKGDMDTAKKTGRIALKINEAVLAEMVRIWPDNVPQTLWMRNEAKRKIRGEKPVESSRERMRNCICCETEFLSEHAGHRMCGNCRSRANSDGLEGYGWHPV